MAPAANAPVYDRELIRVTEMPARFVEIKRLAVVASL